ncbi:hypothetical protein MA04_01940 [Alcanivorax balearicus MACL04]|uniref:Uncharacterized protein n=1 Tax=Alloalcanivorax balearicus MACL04 TaxID=1177182 RepID=A0ABT2QYP2_9GAMM|nr:hypothetical protein [Alloalcanivorax balearicus]MCU5782640.1 hypothetical protein [Alloalcanivorax balearicus MACL04]
MYRWFGLAFGGNVETVTAIFLVVGVSVSLATIYLYALIELRKANSDLSLRDVNKHVSWLSIGMGRLDRSNLSDKDRELIVQVFNLFKISIGGVVLVFFFIFMIFV